MWLDAGKSLQFWFRNFCPERRKANGNTQDGKIWNGILFFVLCPFWLSTTFIPWGLVRFKSCKDSLHAEQWGSCPDQQVASCLCLCSFFTPHWFPLEHQAVDFNSLDVTVQPIPYPLSHPNIKSMFLRRD